MSHARRPPPLPRELLLAAAVALALAVGAVFGLLSAFDRGDEHVADEAALRIESRRSAPPRRSRASQGSARTVSTGQGASRTVRSATLPSSTCLSPLSPLVPITIRSASRRSTSSRMAAIGELSRT
jgi:hypothetical protein